MTALAAGLRADAGLAADFAAGDGFGGFAGFAAGFEMGAGLVAGFPDALVRDVAFELAEVEAAVRCARFTVGFGFGSVMAVPPRDAVDQ